MTAPRTLEEIESALQRTNGNVAAAAGLLRMTREALFKRIRNNQYLREVIKETRYFAVDNAETALQRAVLDGNVTAIIFTLKTLGKDRGYVEAEPVAKTDADHPAQQERAKVYVGVSPDDWDKT